MRQFRRKFGANSSGQLLIVAALMIAILISSTTIYVYELSRETNNVDSYPISDVILAVKQSSKSTMISSLANISKGGERATLEVSLNNLSHVLGNLHQLGMYNLCFAVVNDSRYDSGVCLSWNTSGSGVSSTCANFTLNVQGIAANIAVNYAVNATTSLTINGSYTRLEGEEKLVNLTCQVLNEEEPALFKNITLYYENHGSWIKVNSSNNLSIVDYGNGTYHLSFTVSLSSDVPVSTHVYDLRDVFVQANTTCTEG
ncbi:hypothetical protein KAT21_02440 [Candidatus Bathyarchaeota archaeon]|nr:hypothetical protein [Candidatus Bathyarchaeota archaeon]